MIDEEIDALFRKFRPQMLVNLELKNASLVWNVKDLKETNKMVEESLDEEIKMRQDLEAEVDKLTKRNKMLLQKNKKLKEKKNE